jgi:hypothetical protein
VAEKYIYATMLLGVLYTSTKINGVVYITAHKIKINGVYFAYSIYSKLNQ